MVTCKVEENTKQQNAPVKQYGGKAENGELAVVVQGVHARKAIRIEFQQDIA